MRVRIQAGNLSVEAVGSESLSYSGGQRVSKIRTNLVPTAISLLALVVALSGTAYALTLPDNSVATRHLKDGAVTGKKIGSGAVSGGKVLNGSLSQEDLNFDALSVSGYERVYSGNKPLPAGAQDAAEVDCPPGKVVISGGYWMSHFDLMVGWEHAIDQNTYSVRAYNPTNQASEFGAYAICVKG
jgi:hypothetical protein